MICLSQDLMLEVKETSCASFRLHNLAFDRLCEVVFETVVCSSAVVERVAFLEGNEVCRIYFWEIPVYLL